MRDAAAFASSFRCEFLRLQKFYLYPDLAHVGAALFAADAGHAVGTLVGGVGLRAALPSGAIGHPSRGRIGRGRPLLRAGRDVHGRTRHGQPPSRGRRQRVAVPAQHEPDVIADVEHPRQVSAVEPARQARDRAPGPYEPAAHLAERGGNFHQQSEHARQRHVQQLVQRFADPLRSVEQAPELGIVGHCMLEVRLRARGGDREHFAGEVAPSPLVSPSRAMLWTAIRLASGSWQVIPK